MNDDLLGAVLGGLRTSTLFLGLYGRQQGHDQHRRIQGSLSPNGQDLAVYVAGREPVEQRLKAAGHFAQDSTVRLLGHSGNDGVITADESRFVEASSSVIAELRAGVKGLPVELVRVSASSEELLQLVQEFEKETGRGGDRHRVWALAHTLFFSPASSSQTAGSLLADWLVSAVPSSRLNSNVLEKLSTALSPSSLAEYWPAITEAVLRGQLSLTLSLLRRHEVFLRQRPSYTKEEEDSLVHRLVQVLQDAPMLSSYTTSTRDDWDIWRADVTYYRDLVSGSVSLSGADLEALEDLKVDLESKDMKATQGILNILAGNEADIGRVAETGQGALVAAALYTHPFLSIRDRFSLLPPSLPQRTSETSTPSDTRDALEFALLKGDIYGALRLSSHLDGWLVAHLSYFFDLLGLLDPQDVAQFASGGVFNSEQTSSPLGEWYLVQFAESLFGSGHWLPALVYASCCPTRGSSLVACFARHVPLNLGNVDGVFEDLSRFLEDRGYAESLKELYRSTARLYLSNGNLCRALELYAKAGSKARLWALVSRLLESDPSLEDLEPLTSCLSQRSLPEPLLLLSQYRDLLTISSEPGREQDSLTALVSLLTSGLVPSTLPSLRRGLLEKALGLLERALGLLERALGLLERASGVGPSRDSVLDAAGTFELFRILEELQMAEQEDETYKATTRQLRLALSRNLGVAFACP